MDIDQFSCLDSIVTEASEVLEEEKLQKAAAKACVFLQCLNLCSLLQESQDYVRFLIFVKLKIFS